MNKFYSFLSLMPLVIEIVKATEAALSLGKQGKAKLEFALQLARIAYMEQESLRVAWPNKTEFLATINYAVMMVVLLLNNSGVFRKSEAAL